MELIHQNYGKFSFILNNHTIKTFKLFSTIDRKNKINYKFGKTVSSYLNSYSFTIMQNQENSFGPKGGGTDLERGYGDVRPQKYPFHTTPIVHKGPI